MNQHPMHAGNPIPQVFPVTFHVEEWNQILSILSEQPFRIAAPLINGIQQQAQAFRRNEQAKAEMHDRVAGDMLGGIGAGAPLTPEGERQAEETARGLNGHGSGAP